MFGSIDYVHADDQIRTKLDDKSKKMIFMGYDQKSKGYKLYNPNKGKTMISRNVKFDEERVWDSKVDDGEKYDFLPVLDEEDERYKDHQKLVTPSQLPMNLTSPLSSSFSGSSNSGSPLSPPRKMRSLDDLYEVTNVINDDLTLYCHLAINEFIVFEKANKLWKVENCYGWGDCINWEEWHMKTDSKTKKKETNRCQVDL